MLSPGERLRRDVRSENVLGFVGVYDAFSASIAARQSAGIFLSGFGFAASQFGLPDTGFVTWSDMLEFASRVRAIAPNIHMLVDIDDGFADSDTAVHVAHQLEQRGASGVVLEDQARPRKCGHLGDKNLLPVSDYIERLNSVLSVRRELFVVARTDATRPDDIHERVLAIEETDADAVLVDGQANLEFAQELRHLTEKPLAFNQILGGKSPAFSETDLAVAGISLAIFSTPLLFAAQAAMEKCLTEFHGNGLDLDAIQKTATLQDCQCLLTENRVRAQAGPTPNFNDTEPNRTGAQGSAPVGGNFSLDKQR